MKIGNFYKDGRKIRKFSWIFAGALVRLTVIVGTILGFRQASAQTPENVSVPTAAGEEGRFQTVLLRYNVELKLIHIPAGRFLMGSPDSEPGRRIDEAEHLCAITQDYWMGETEVTQAQWRAVMGDPRSFQGDKYPAQVIRWQDAMEFCQKLNQQHPIPGMKFTLPSEAQWEYACRAGTTTAFCFGDSLDSTQANIRKKGNLKNDIKEVKCFPPNAWGLYDMHGNVEEWCLDSGEGNVEEEASKRSKLHILRGGRYLDSAEYCRSASRIASEYGHSSACGFRIILVSEEGIKAQQAAEEKIKQTIEKQCLAEKLRLAQETVRTFQNNGSILLPNNVELKLIHIPAGDFLMGSPDSEPGRRSDEVQHQVFITQDYWLGETEVTQAQWLEIMGYNGTAKGSKYPAQSITWERAMEFCEKLNREHPIPGMRFTLPSEAQWEYACRAGTATAFSFGSSLDSTQANIREDRNRENHIAEVKSFPPNAWGLYDMHGNVEEWCLDSGEGDIVEKISRQSASHILRGGRYRDSAEYCRSASRIAGSSQWVSDTWGFRIVLIPEKGLKAQQAAEEKAKRNFAKQRIAEKLRLSGEQGKRFEKDGVILLPNNVELKLIHIPAGDFLMGSPDSEPGRRSDEVQHQVFITQDYWLGETEVTQAQWLEIMGYNGTAKGSKYPAQSITWERAMEFCEKLNREHPIPGMRFTLPSEAQWEYACRAGTTTAFSFGDSLDSAQANIRKKEKTENRIAEVKSFPPNAWGLYEMHGNVSEWCLDLKEVNVTFTSTSNGITTVGSKKRLEHIIRGGGCFYDDAEHCRSAYRNSMYWPEELQFVAVPQWGFRIALVSKQGLAVQRAAEEKAKREVAKQRLAEELRLAEEKKKSIEKDRSILLPNNVELKLIHIPAGRFLMGSPTAEAGRRSNEMQHWVTLTNDYWLGETEVTQEQWQAVMGKNPSYFKNGGRYPVENITWDEAMAFCQKLNEKHLVPGMKFSLPSEAQWEYACRAGTTTAFGYGDSLDSTLANFDGTHPYGLGKKGTFREKTVEVKSFRPNAWGLYDMHGNVYEWCMDSCYFNKPADEVITDTYAGESKDPVNKSGTARIRRGGGWYFRAGLCRSAFRYCDLPNVRRDYLGFRIALFPEESDMRNMELQTIAERLKKFEQDGIVMLPGNVEIKLIHIPAGRFQMGSPASEPGRAKNEPQHWVTLTSDYWLGETEVTQEQWQAVMKKNPSHSQNGDNCPVQNISWNEAMEFCENLNKKYPILGYKFILPTEAQWEYACRAGTTTAFCYGDSLDSTQANFDGTRPYGTEKKEIFLKKTVDVKSFLPNDWGLYDMHGNVEEYCLDHCDYRKSTDEVVTDTYRADIKDPVSRNGAFRIFRGGCWHRSARSNRSAVRGCIPPDSGWRGSGLRVAIVPEETYRMETTLLYLDRDGTLQSIEDGSKCTLFTDQMISQWRTGWYVVDRNVTIPAGVHIYGDVKLLLKDGCTLSIKGQNTEAGICVTNGTLSIYAQSTGTAMGKLNVLGGSDGGAGIGGKKGETGRNIFIYGGCITAIGGHGAAGIGGGNMGNGSHIVIHGGRIQAEGRAGGAGIGGGNGGNAHEIKIQGGAVRAESKGSSKEDQYGAGIGGGSNASGAFIMISGGSVTAAGGAPNVAGIGSGSGDAISHSITISTKANITADNHEPPINKIRNSGNDLAAQLSEKRYVNIRE